jgi:hypothetical protein
MRDDIQQSLADLGHAAQRAAAPVGFAGIRRRARRRRRAQAVSAVALCVVAAGAGLGIDQATGSHGSVGPVHHGSPHPSPTTAPTPDTPSPTPRLSARQIVEDPDAFVVASTVDPHDVRQAATLWGLGRSGPMEQFAVTETTDDYHHVQYVPVRYRFCEDIRAVGAQRFWLSCGGRHQLLVGSDGSATAARVDLRPAPVPGDAVLVWPVPKGRGGAVWGWVDQQGAMRQLEATGPLSLVHAPDGRIWGLDYQAAVNGRLIWSTDDGRSWSSRTLPGPGVTTNAYVIVPTAVPGRMVLARGVPETMFRPHSLLVLGPNGEQLRKVTFGRDPGAVEGMLVTGDGTLILELYNEPEGGRSGLYRAASGAWRDPQKVLDPPTRPSGQTAGSSWMGSSRDSSGRPVVWAVFDSGVLATSTDDGRTWTTHSIR